MRKEILALSLIAFIFVIGMIATTEARRMRYPAGDINQDCIVDEHDLKLVGEFYGQERGDPRYIPSIDINGDGKININDLAIVGLNYGKECRR